MTSASLILQGGRVWAPHLPSGVAEAVAVEGSTIVAVGDEDDVAPWRGPATRVVDLRGRLVIPAFGDAHVHAVSAGLESLRCNLLGLRTRHECLEQISRYAATLAPDGWVLGGGWSMESFPGGVPTAADLDGATGGRPAFLPNRDHHSAWVNSAALARAGVDARTPDPASGRIERDAEGRPTGTLHESAMALVTRHLPPTTPQDLEAGLHAALARLHSLGITHFQDACVGEAGDIGVPDSFETYRGAARDGWLSARVRGALWWDRSRGLEQIDELLARREAAPEGGFRATSVKMMVDGVCENFTAAMSRAYLGEPGQHGTHRGELFIDEQMLARAVSTLDGLGFQVHFHAIGDRAITTALDAIEGLGERSAVHRHHVAHLQFIAPPDVARFARLGAIANFQPLWAATDPQMEELTLPFVGDERAQWQYSIGSIWRSGGRVAFGSDWPVSSPDPLQEMHVAVNRLLSTRLGRAGERETTVPFRVSEALTLREALDAFSRNVAYVNGDEDRLGSLEVGYQADLAVLSQDLFALPSSEIGDVEVELTVASGEVVFGED